MRVALLSFHNAYNFGAALQAYGLQNALEQIGVDCEYINYVNISRREEYSMIAQIRREMKKKNYIRVAKLVVGTPFMLRRKRNFDAFYSMNLRKTTEVYTTSKQAESLNELYDKFIVGSDQVWNPENNGGDCAFLLDFVHDNSKRISYSSSFGVQKVPSNYEVEYARNLAKFYRLATRETAGVKIIKQLCNRDAHLVLDPVFLPDKNIWETLANKVKKPLENYVFFYTNRKSQIDDFLSTGYSMKQTKIHILSSHVTFSDFLNRQRAVKFSMSPEQFLSEIKNAKLVVTASFHCLTFAIIFHKPFIAILTGDRGKDERILNLLRMCGLENRVLTNEVGQNEIDMQIDYDIVDANLSKYLKSSKDYLYNALFDKEDIDFICNRMPNSNEIHNITEIADDCTGCGVCELSCPQSAINMNIDNEGFKKPNVKKNSCINCGKCLRKCHVYNLPSQNVGEQHYFGYKNSEIIRKKSSSGGAFTLLAERVLNEKGVVCGAVMNQDFKVEHDIVTSSDELEKMRGTFYVQSDLRNCFTRIRDLLDKGIKVLFVGTPCQVAGLKKYLGINYDNLLLVDIICHGVPSPLVFQKFVDELKLRGKLTSFKFRDPENGWRGYHVSAVIDGKKISNKLWLQSFNNLFSHNIINRKSCGNCQYACYDRQGDITIGDFWGIEKVDSSFEDSNGISLILTNTPKGFEFITSCTEGQMKEYAKEDTIQNSLIKSAHLSSKRRDAFRILQEEGYSELAKKYGEDNFYGWIKDIVRKCFFR